MRTGLVGLAFAAAVIVAAWAWLGAPVAMPNAPLAAGEKLWCISYAPYRGDQTPYDLATRIPAAQLDEDLGRLSPITGCVRTYSDTQGLEQIPALAAKHGMKVLQGIWLAGIPALDEVQITNGVALAKAHPDTIRALVVGNEVLLRGEKTGTDLANIIRSVKAEVSVPVTYADVWEFWLRNPEVAAAVDFITIHILPYWEDFPIPAEQAAAHVEAIRRKVAAAFPGKEIVIGEVGWPSAGRMREGALPSPANQARVIQDVLALAKRENFKVNVIESFDASWKRAQEGTVGAHWGLFDGATRKPKFHWGEAVSNHPRWRWQAAGGVAYAVLVFAAALAAARGRKHRAPVWLAVTANAIAGGILIGWTIENVPLESLGAGAWTRSLALAAAAFASPILASLAVVTETPAPPMASVLAIEPLRKSDRLASALGLLLVVTLLLSVQVALGLVFDPRYKDFPFAPLTAAIVPLLVHGLTVGQFGKRGAAETAGAGLLLLAAIYIVPNETLANWQSLWLCAAFAALALTLLRVRGARS
ncbi:MAG TPA: beta-(1-6) glucans synthase [Pseudolabrys sp.]|jgi:glucan 1,3-beta-glucosidase|nr:beta-(1-6) glucans synthase [Pseudolabrys sp.]